MRPIISKVLSFNWDYSRGIQFPGGVWVYPSVTNDHLRRSFQRNCLWGPVKKENKLLTTNVGNSFILSQNLLPPGTLIGKSVIVTNTQEMPGMWMFSEICHMMPDKKQKQTNV